MLNEIQPPAWYSKDHCDLDAFKSLLERSFSRADAPHASDIIANIPVYDGTDARRKLLGAGRAALLSEWAAVLERGAGVLAVRGGFSDLSVIDRATEVFNAIIAEEKAGGDAVGDHFAASGANDRVWNAHQKLCLRDPATFAAYMANPLIAGVAEAWLGPGYQVTAQVNLVHPGGAAQQAHRDYHLGFQTLEGAAAFPAHLHRMSAGLTLQGAVAHCDMPVESGPTKLLPFSQGFGPGYLAFHLPEFRALFEERHVQLPLSKGDLLFFSPALFHAAGENRTRDIARMANLLQISGGMGRAMEALDRDAMCRAIFPHLAQYTGRARSALIAATAEGYAFPTNLDRDPPIGGLAPKTQAEILAESSSLEELSAELDALQDRQKP